jgi:hypothetical protein
MITMDIPTLEPRGNLEAVVDSWAKPLLRNAARAAIEAVAEEFVRTGKIKTGEAIGSLKPIARAVRAAFYAGGPKSGLGASKSGYSINDKFPVYSITWHTLVAHFALSEQYNLTHRDSGTHITGTPWNFWIKGYEAFYNYLRENWKDTFPPLRAFFRIQRVRI